MSTGFLREEIQMLNHFMRGYEIDPDSLEDSDVLQKLFKKVDPKDLKKLKLTFDRAIDKYVDNQQKQDKLVWTGFGPFVGEESILSESNRDFFWDTIYHLYKGDSQGAEKLRRQTGGTFFMWRIAVRDEAWWCYDDENKSGKIDPVTGEVYKVYQYWINENLKKRK